LKLSAEALRRFEVAPEGIKKEESPSKETISPTSVVPPTVTSPNGINAPESSSNTPVPNGTPGPTSMPPPTEGVKKKGVKRSSAVALGSEGTLTPKVRGKPGPKKKARLEDGTIDHTSTLPRALNTTGAHKLGPKANQGAINAGLRALDRTGKPCRKWQKGSFKVKSFTGVIWEIPRWTAPPKIKLNPESDSSDSSKENENENGNKDSSRLESEKSNSIAMEANTPDHNASSPAPVATPTAPVENSTPVVTTTA